MHGKGSGKKVLEELATNERARELLKAGSITKDAAPESVYAEVARAVGFDVTAEETMDAADEIRKKQAAATEAAAAEITELSLSEMDQVAGGARDWATEGCEATVENHSWCWSNDSCFVAQVEYVNPPSYYTCPKCGYTMYSWKNVVEHGMPVKYYKCPKCGEVKTEIPPHSLK